jgi:PiT family inorganic phosphate transporter
MRNTFRGMQILSSAFMAFSHGSNDGQKFMGAFTLALVLGNALPVFAIPKWVIFLCAAVMALGTITGGWRIMRTLGMKVTKLETHQGFAAETAAATTIELATRLGIPLSTTHTISTSIMGVGAVRGVSAVRWGVTQELVTAWVLTFPICAGISFGVVKLIRWFA